MDKPQDDGGHADVMENLEQSQQEIMAVLWDRPENQTFSREHFAEVLLIWLWPVPAEWGAF